jgi:ribosomal protein S18 acetylase RimI-like enzyme
VTAPTWTANSGIEVLDLRHFSASALRPLLEEEKELWARSLAWDYGSSADMILRYAEGKILPGYVALQHGLVAGYCFFVYEGSKGVIGDLFVRRGTAPERSTEFSLLSHTLATLQQSPGVHRVEAQLLLHEAGTVAEPFLREGFRQYPRLFMVLPLEAATKPRQIAMPVGVEIRRWSEPDYHPAAAAITASYAGHIDADINDQYRSPNGSLRFLNNIVRFPGCGVFDNAASFVAIDQSSRALVGLILCSRVQEGVGHVTQICVVPEWRGRKLGEALLRMTMAELQRRQFSKLTLTVTQNNRAVELYRRLGFGIGRVFDAFVWDQ